MKYLLNTVVTYRVHTVEDAEALHQELKKDSRFELTAFSYSTKDVKAKGELIDQYQVVKAKLVFATEKEPEGDYDIDFTEV
jgi:hypothetical protein